MRGDARRNRDRLLSAARAAFLAEGTNIPMDAIARRAEVGVGTLYRHFADRDALVRAVASDSMENLIRIGRAVQVDELDPWRALQRLIRSGSEHRAALAVVGPRMLATMGEDHDLLAAVQEWYELLARTVEGAQEQGRLRLDVGPGDVVMLITQLSQPVAGFTGDAAAGMRERFLEVLLDGLCARSTSALPGRPPRVWWAPGAQADRSS